MKERAVHYGQNPGGACAEDEDEERMDGWMGKFVAFCLSWGNIPPIQTQPSHGELANTTLLDFLPP
jgi:hypothetical protein